MTHFTIDTENNITAYPTRADAESAAMPDAEAFHGDNFLVALPTDRLIEIWNGIAGVKPVTKFTSRVVAAKRIWVVGYFEKQAA